MILCTQTPIGWLAQHRINRRFYAFGRTDEIARAKLDEQLKNYDRAQFRVTLKRMRG